MKKQKKYLGGLIRIMLFEINQTMRIIVKIVIISYGLKNAPEYHKLLHKEKLPSKKNLKKEKKKKEKKKFKQLLALLSF